MKKKILGGSLCSILLVPWRSLKISLPQLGQSFTVLASFHAQTRAKFRSYYWKFCFVASSWSGVVPSIKLQDTLFSSIQIHHCAAIHSIWRCSSIKQLKALTHMMDEREIDGGLIYPYYGECCGESAQCLKSHSPHRGEAVSTFLPFLENNGLVKLVRCLCGFHGLPSVCVSTFPFYLMILIWQSEEMGELTSDPPSSCQRVDTALSRLNGSPLLCSNP